VRVVVRFFLVLNARGIKHVHEFLRHAHRIPLSVIDGDDDAVTHNGAIVDDDTILDDCAMMGQL